MLKKSIKKILLFQLLLDICNGLNPFRMFVMKILMCLKSEAKMLYLFLRRRNVGKAKIKIDQ
ncbi:MAG: hypothetical protein B7C24_08205 [Bacteroidetes bacterium 4572_77]|nr:MAG: hypothetical protein B7C24_08205 [Bacteroidetes bacterium 4572_77]